MDEIAGPNTGKVSCSFAQRLQPLRGWLRGREARIVEIVTPPETLCFAIASPAVEAERRQIDGGQPFYQLPLFRFADDLLLVSQPLDERCVKQQAHGPNSSLSSDGLSSGASCSNVHCFASLS